MIKKIYLDMDGVLTDFEKRFAEKFGYPAMAVRDRKNFSIEWPQFIADKEFETLEWFPGGQQLLSFIREHNHITVEMLTSSGGVKHHEEVKEQKKIWLKKMGITYKPHVVPGRKHKAKYAEPDVVLIDDTKDIIDSFNAAGGIGILHRNVDDTINTLKELL
jgi:FMN phosphatase YigB (HAD superfamily)